MENKNYNVVSNPAHYVSGGLETIDILKAKLSKDEFKGFLLGNIIKYITRAEKKNGLEDYKKAQWYLTELIKIESEEK